MRMHRTALLVLLYLLAAAGAGAQVHHQKIYRAIVIDSLQKTPLEGCTVSFPGLKKDGDKTVATNSKGTFSFTLQHDSVEILIEHVGYSTKSRTVYAAKTDSLSDTIRLAPVSKEMEEVVIKTSVPPIVIRGDTTEYNIDSSMFEPFDVVADLLKRLPGLQIDAEGRMSFHGKPITRILVDGEDLFGGDPNFSLQKLPAGMVAKIQVMDSKTLEELFNNTPSDGEEKTLNIRLKEGNKFFGTANAMAGTRNQFEAGGNLSQFNNQKRINITGSTNTSNKLGLFKRGNGPSSTQSNAGINYGNKFGNLRINSSYGYSSNSNSNRMLRERTQILTADTSILTKSANLSESEGNSHRVSLNGNWFIDSTSSMDVSFSVNKSNSKNQSTASSSTFENGIIRNESMNNNNAVGNSQGLTANLQWMKRLNRNGRNLSLTARTNLADQHSTLLSESYNRYFKSGIAVNGDTLYRETITNGTNNGYAFGFSYMEPLSKALRIGLRGDADFNSTTTNREIYNLDSVTHSAKFDSLYSAKIASYNATQNIGLSINYNSKKWNLSSGFTTVLQQTVRQLQNDEIRQHLLRYAPSVNASYTFAKAKTIRANFSANTIQPTIEQLQPVPDNSNPLYVRLGNPELRTAFSQNYGLTYSYYDTSRNLNASIAYAPISNQIVNEVFYDQFRRQTSRYVNVDGVYTLRGSVYYNRTKRNAKRNYGWGTSSNLSYGQQVFSQSNKLYYTRNYSVDGELSYSLSEYSVRANTYRISLGATTSRNWTPADTRILNTSRLNITPKIEGSLMIAGMVYVNGNYSVWYNKLDYHSDLRKNDEYSIHNFNAAANIFIGKLFNLQSNFQYQYNSQTPEGASKGLPNFNLSASALVLKRRGQLILTAADLFMPNNNLRRVVGDNYIEDVQMENLRNYFTLRFQYSFSRLDKRKPATRSPLMSTRN